MELRQLITLRTIVEVGGFSKAAEALGYAQSSITAHIKGLEEELGYPLFDRLGKKITLTEAGRRFLPYAIDIIELYSESKEVIKDADKPSGSLTIGATETVMTYLLPNIIMDFTKKYPRIELTLKPLDYDNIATQFKKGDIDIGMLVELSTWEPEELVVHKLRNEKLCLVQSAKVKRISETMLYAEKSCSYRPVFDEYLRMEGKAPVSRIELPSTEAIKKCVLCGMGKSFLPYFTINDEIKKGELEEINSNAEDSSIAVYAALHKKKWSSVNISVFLKLLKEQLG